MSLFLFLGVLVFLIVAHELGHFAVAKFFKVRVDEFGVGYPPRAFSFGKIGGTEYTLNWLPFGGFVKIFGENPEEDGGGNNNYSMNSKPKLVQISILVAGVVANMLVAWFLFSASYMSGSPVAIPETESFGVDTSLMISSVLPASPADSAGLKNGSLIKSIRSGDITLESLSPTAVSEFISTRGGKNIEITWLSAEGKESTATIIPAHGIIGSAPGVPAVGIKMALISNEKISFFRAVWKGFEETYISFVGILFGIFSFIYSIFAGTAVWSSVAGPVGIANLIGDASSVGLNYLIKFTAFISVNLAVINLLPIPALDGGRIFLIIIESIIRRPIPKKFASGLNFFGFAALVLLMIVVTYHDIVRLFV